MASSSFGDEKTKSAMINVTLPTLDESNIGISQYVTPSEGFQGIIKQRISDFHVNEIGFDGKVSKLTDFSLPKIPTENISTEKVIADDYMELLTKENYDAICGIEKAGTECVETVLIDVTSMDKIQRTRIHHTIKTNFKTITSSTYDEEEKKFIKCSKLNKSKKSDRRSKWRWPQEYTYFLLHKDNIDTMQAVSMLAPLLNIKAASLMYAGTKDKRGKTTQWLCVKRREPLQIVKAAQRARQMFVGNFMFCEKPLRLGQLSGNRFRIAIREIVADEKLISEILANFKNYGFINYYGHQRFGISTSVPTHQIGLALLQCNFKKACELILKPRENDGHEMRAMRQSWLAHRDASEALQLLGGYDRRGQCIEEKLLSGLAKHGENDYLNALENVPRNTRLMYIHSYQSLIWNEIASRRIANYGLNLCEGDLVYVDGESTNAETLDDDRDAGDENSTDDNNCSSPDEICSVYRLKVRPLTETDAKSGSYTIFDVVLPLPGHDITYPSNKFSNWYEERLLEDNLSSEKLKLKQKTYSLTGAYRKLLVKPNNTSWYFMKYNQETDTLIRSDLEEIRGCPKPQSFADGLLKALILEFDLPTASYATMALREITKTDTSTAYQIHLQQKSNLKQNDKEILDDYCGARKKARIE